MTAWHRPDVETAALEYLSQVIAPASARQIVDGLLAKGRAQRDDEVQKLRDRAAELEQQLAVRSFYLAENEDAENGPTLHTSADAAKAWCDDVEPGDWFEDEDGVWVQCDTDPDTDRPTTGGAGTVTPLTVQGDGIVAEAERIRQTFLEKSTKLATLLEHQANASDEIRRLQTEQGEVMKALGCERYDEWDDVVHRARQLAGQPRHDFVCFADDIGGGE